MNYFTKSETQCKCGCGMDIKDETRNRLNIARVECGIPIYLTNGARCIEHNKEIGGAKNSDHIYGTAVDVQPQSVKSKYKIMKALMNAGFDRIFVYMDKDIIHAGVSGVNPGPIFQVRET